MKEQHFGGEISSVTNFVNMRTVLKTHNHPNDMNTQQILVYYEYHEYSPASRWESYVQRQMLNVNKCNFSLDGGERATGMITIEMPSKKGRDRQ